MGFLFSKQKPPPTEPSLMENGWREISCENKDEMKMKLSNKPRHLPIDHFRILMAGPISAGKSSFISSIESIVQNKMINASCKVSAGDSSFTKTYTTQTFRDENRRPLQFVIGDVMGLERKDRPGVLPEDIISILRGHIKDGYKFNPMHPCSPDDSGYNREPTLNDKCHCLVFVIPIDMFVKEQNKASCRLPEDVVEQVRNIREKAAALKIPQVVLLTKVDLACPEVKKDIKRIYKSTEVFSKVEACGSILGIPINCLFPIRNYSNEMRLNPDMDAVLLYTLLKILDAANDSVEQIQRDKGAECHSMDEPIHLRDD